MIAKRLWTYLAIVATALLGINQLATELFGPDSPIHLGAGIQKWLAWGALAALAYRRMKDDNHNGIPDVFEPEAWQSPTLGAISEARAEQRAKVLGLLILLGGVTVLSACRSAAAQPTHAMSIERELQDLRIGAPCKGPTGMTGCLISIYDSTAGVSLASNVAVNRDDTLWRTRPCVVIGTVVIGGQFVGTAAGLNPSPPIGARGTGSCNPVAGQPFPVIIITASSP